MKNPSAPGGALHALAIRGLGAPPGEVGDLNVKLAHPRAEVQRLTLAHFCRLGGLKPGYNWALYNLPPVANITDESIPGHTISRELLLLVDARDPSSTPPLRFITNEYYQAADRSQVFTKDIMVAHGIAQMRVNAYEAGGSQSCNSSPIITALVGTLAIVNYQDRIQQNGVQAFIRPGSDSWFEPTRLVHADPFGKLDDPLDQFDALTAAQDLLAEVTNTQPTQSGVQQRIG